MKIETHSKENDLCLLRYDDKYYYIGCIDLPQDTWTIGQYNEWRCKYTFNLISLTDNFVPQVLPNSGLVVECALGDVCNYYAEKHYCGHENFNKNGKFKDLLIELLSLEKSQYIHTFRSWVESFYKPHEQTI